MFRVPFCLLFTVFILAPVRGQAPSTYFREEVKKVSPDTIYKCLQEFENLGIKQLNTLAIEDTRHWLSGKFESLGYQVSLDSFMYSGDSLYNIIADKKGEGDSNTWVIICAHYDTQNGPGANDNGSGIAVMLEIARLIRNLPTYYSVRFIGFSAEEPGFKGSIHYVDNKVVPAGMQIRVVFNIDQVGGSNTAINNTITCERDEAGQTGNNAQSFHFTNMLDTMMRKYGGLNTVQGPAFLSDYIPFELNGYVITGLYETNVSPFRHSINDSLRRVDTAYLFKVARGAYAAGMKFSGIYDLNTALPKTNEVPALKLYPNPASDLIFLAGYNMPVSISVITIDGSILSEMSVDPGQGIDVSKLPPSVYIMRIITPSDVAFGRFIKR